MDPQRPAETPSTGADHEELLGASEWMRYRSRRVGATELADSLRLAFELEGAAVEVRLLDVSPTGMAVEPDSEVSIAPGTVLRSAVVRVGDREVWTGDAVVVYQVDPPGARLGLRFLSKLFDLNRLHHGSESSVGRLEESIRLQERWLAELPGDYLVAVGALRRLLRSSRDALERREEDISRNVDPYDPEEERRAIVGFYESWGPRYHEQLRRLTEISSHLDQDQVELARSLATSELLSSLYGCPMHRRAYDKPFGYAGDYLMMLLYFAERLTGSSVYARFLHYVSQQYPLGRTVVAREQTMRQKIAGLVAEGRPIRILSLACGPALEVQRFLAELEELQHPLRLTLIDQDEQAMQYCHENLNRQLLECSTSVQLNVELDCLHLSVRQIVQPRDEAERRMVERTLSELDLIYSAGLYDYLSRSVAIHLTEKLFSMLGPGGRLMLGNLKHCDVTSWVMDSVLAWHLVYRSEEAMLDLASTVDAAEAEVITDATGRCMFLDVRKRS